MSRPFRCNTFVRHERPCPLEPSPGTDASGHISPLIDDVHGAGRHHPTEGVGSSRSRYCACRRHRQEARKFMDPMVRTGPRPSGENPYRPCTGWTCRWLVVTLPTRVASWKALVGHCRQPVKLYPIALEPTDEQSMASTSPSVTCAFAVADDPEPAHVDRQRPA